MICCWIDTHEPPVIYFLYMDLHPSYTGVLTHYLASATIIGAVITVLLVVYVVASMTQKKQSWFGDAVSRHILPLGFCVALCGVALSLFYSEVLHFAPCDLCWYQRIFLYPQVFLFGYAWYKKDRSILPYSILLSCVGFVVGVYHHMLQIGYDLMKPCSSAPFAVDCSKPSFIEYGFVTFPFMAAVLFGFLGTLVVIAVYRKK